MKQRVVLAYSGNAESTRVLRRLAARPRSEVSTLTLDLGQGEDLEEVRERALDAGARRAHVLDVREALARDYVMPSLRAGVFGGDLPSMVAAVGCPLIVRKLAEIAAIENVTTLAHACADDRARVRLERLVNALDPALRVLDCGLVEGRWARRRFEAEVERGGPRLTVNVLGRAMSAPGDAGNVLAATGTHPLTKAPESAPDGPAVVEIAFDRGIPVALNDVAMALTELLESLTIIAGQHGVGRVESPTRPGADSWSRAGEAPAAVVLHAAYSELASRVFAEDLQRLVAGLSPEYADVIEGGWWFTPRREALDAFFAALQLGMTGVVRMKLFKGAQVVGNSGPATSDEGCVRGAQGAEVLELVTPS